MTSASTSDSCGGITIGFIFGLLIIYGLEMLMGYLEELTYDSIASFAAIPGFESANPMNEEAVTEG
jgi:hypothetical protein